jgi:hypothetical protein
VRADSALDAGDWTALLVVLTAVIGIISYAQL